ncbi:unnamed protein product [Alternaria alternata]
MWKCAHAAQQDPANQELLRLLNREWQAQEKQREAQDELRSGAKVVPEKGLNVNLKNVVDSQSKRLRKRPEGFSDIKWTDSGKRGATISAAELRAREVIALGEEEDGSSDDFEESGSSALVSDLEEETHERPLTDKQRAKLDSKAARKARPTMDDVARQLAIKLLDDHDRVYTEEDLDEDVHLARALELIHSKKLGLPFDTVPGNLRHWRRGPEAHRDGSGEVVVYKVMRVQDR